MITGTQENSEVEIDVIANGHFYYNWSQAGLNEGITAMLMRDLDSGEVTRDVNLDGTFYFINTTTGSCYHFKIPGVNGPAAPTWLKVFTYNETQYLNKLEGSPDAHWEAAAHWGYDAFGGGPQHLFNYWHTEDAARTPTRIMGPSLTKPPYGHSFIELDHYVKGLDVPNVDKLFVVPANCPGPLDVAAVAQAARTGDHAALANHPAHAHLELDHAHLAKLVARVRLAGWLSPLVLLSERAVGGELEDLRDAIEEVERELRPGMADKAARRASAAPANLSYPLWPAQFSCNHTGNGKTNGAHTQQTQKGVFYYDSPKHRSATVLYDVQTGARSKEIVVEGRVYSVSSAGCTSRAWTITDLIPPDFLKYFEQQKDQYVLRNHTASLIVPGAGDRVDGLGIGKVVYSRTSHWTYADPASDHATHAWMELSNGMPLQLLGLTGASADAAPSSMDFRGLENVTVGLQGVDLDDLFHIPAGCHAEQIIV